MTGELDFFDTQVSTETLGADKEEWEEKREVCLFHIPLTDRVPAGLQWSVPTEPLAALDRQAVRFVS